MSKVASLPGFKRIVKDFQALNDPPEGIYAKLRGDQLDLIFMMLVGPRDSPYDGCLYFFTIDPTTQFMPDANGLAYPFNPPKVLHYSPYSIRVHPNLYTPSGGGKVCLSILGTWAGPPWIPAMSFHAIAQTILGIMDNEPLRAEPSFEKGHNEAVAKYTEYVRYVCIRELVERIFLAPRKGVEIGIHGYGTLKGTQYPFYDIFHDEIESIFNTRKGWYIEKLMLYHKRFLGLQVTPGCYGDMSYSGKPYEYDMLSNKLQNSEPKKGENNNKSQTIERPPGPNDPPRSGLGLGKLSLT